MELLIEFLYYLFFAISILIISLLVFCVLLLIFKLYLIIIDIFYKIVEKHFRVHLCSGGRRYYSLKSKPPASRWYPGKN